MKLYISGFKNISYNILVGYLSNYYMYHISSKYINTIDEIKHNMPFKINYFLYNNYSPFPLMIRSVQVYPIISLFFR